MNDYPDDYDEDTSDGYIVEDGSTILIFLLGFCAIALAGVAAKLIGVL